MKNNHRQTRKTIPLSFIALTALALSSIATVSAAEQPIPKHDGKPADMTKPVQVFILMGQSNMVGLGKVKGGEISLEHAVKEKKKYHYLVDDAGAWTERKDVRYVQYMPGKGPLRNEWMTVAGGNLGPEYGLGHSVGNAIDAPVMILKCCIGNRALGWDLLPPGSERSVFVTKDNSFVEKKLVYDGYKDKPEFWEMDPDKGLKTEPAPWLDKNGKPIDWYAGKQWDSDIGDAKKALADLDKHYPGAKSYEVAGFFFFATIYTTPMAQGGSGNGHYGGKAEVYMDVGEAMGQAMVQLLKGTK